MKTNPEEFVPDIQFGASKWGNLIDRYRQFLSDEDNKAIDDAWKETVHQAMQQKFTEQVMKELLAPEEDDSLGKWFTKPTSGMPLGGQTPVRSSVTLNNTNAVTLSHTLDAQAYQMEQMKLHLEAHKMALKQEEKKHTTLFGKLFNYS